ncbi:YL1 nuclear protein-domain-containing protein [Syncephalastrum racemosum]|uniref:YL1 nuclear protein-domain-containing protein n=1 Tax=Syncephalastrum racemosum TaxID=13706 RepID=A0A1X2H4I7_SYNRA|nr:YL1 nuclear protein-domain-containing protein [Syncephalastrum racemosum]
MSFVQQRERRSNAGNRMRALLDQEIDMVELFEDTGSDDEEFEKEEDDEEAEDIVDSDFHTESSDEEDIAREEGNEEDKEIAREERQERKRAEQKVTLTASKRQPARRSQPTYQERQRRRQERRLALDQGPKRQSSRATTVKSRLYTEEQIQTKLDQMAARAPKPAPLAKKPQMTQEQLLAEAAHTEEHNRASLNKWQALEAERKAAARKKTAQRIKGPFIRYHSYTDGRPDQRPRKRKLFMISFDDSSNTNVSEEINDPQALAWHQQHDWDTSAMEGRTVISFMNDKPLTQKSNVDHLTDKELDRLELIPELANWVDREPMPVQPLLCPVTGQVARYRDPKTQVPFANLEAYRVIQSCLAQEVPWSPEIGVYLGNERGAAGVPAGWDDLAQYGSLQPRTNQKPSRHQTRT